MMVAMNTRVTTNEKYQPDPDEGPIGYHLEVHVITDDFEEAQRFMAEMVKAVGIVASEVEE